MIELLFKDQFSLIIFIVQSNGKITCSIEELNKNIRLIFGKQVHEFWIIIEKSDLTSTGKKRIIDDTHKYPKLFVDGIGSQFHLVLCKLPSKGNKQQCC